MKANKRILMIASENDALVGGKVGGIGDVVRDIPVALADLGCTADVLTPAYQMFSRLPGAVKVSSFDIEFAGSVHQVDLYKVPPKEPVQGVTHWALELPLRFYGDTSGIYFNDPATAPFATDATKFACFCAAAGAAIIKRELPTPDVIHLHDWHSALLLLLRDSDPAYAELQAIPCVYTIHNLGLQGIRPLNGHDSALESWFPTLDYQRQQIVDPRAQDCVNPMRAGINLADRVHVVSPTYAEEILLPSEPDRGYIGGEGLQEDLNTAHSQGKLVGILNGCTYPDKKTKKVSLQKLMQILEQEIMTLISKNSAVDSALYIAQRRVDIWSRKKRCDLIVTSVGRITDQKIAILQQQLPSGKSALETLLLELGSHGVFILLGSGDQELEQFLTNIAGRHNNFIFVKGYAENLSDVLYQSGDLFLMPSSFEPCGISQMLSMRAGQPCLVHSVGGLRDTVVNDSNGFSFEGDSVQQQAANLVQRFVEVKNLKQSNAEGYSEISDAAGNARFLWKQSAEEYIARLYQS